MDWLIEELKGLIENSSQKMFFGAIAVWLVYLAIRIVPQIIMAVALNKEAKRHNKQNMIWAIAGYAFPIIAPIVFFIYIKLSENKLQKYDRKGISKGAIISFVISLIIIFVSFATALTSFALGIGSFIRSQVTGEHLISFYDKMGNEYDELDFTIDMYDRDGNKYSYKKDGLLDPVVYVDKDGNEYDAEKCFIDAEGWFFYDKDGLLSVDDSSDRQFVCTRFEDKDGNKYFQLSYCCFQIDENGDIWASLGKIWEKLDFGN